jgi:hypothetical protein
VDEGAEKPMKIVVIKRIKKRIRIDIKLIK